MTALATWLGGFVLLGRSEAALSARYGASAVAGSFAGEYSGKLSNSGEALSLDCPGAAGQPAAAAAYTDHSFPAADGGGAALGWSGSGWVAVVPDPGGSCVAGGSPLCQSTIWVAEGPVGVAAGVVLINELNYHPPNVDTDQWWDSGQCRMSFESKLGGDANEFIELLNTGTTTVDLAGWSVAGGVWYTFPADVPASLSPGGLLLLCRNIPVDPTAPGGTPGSSDACCAGGSGGAAAVAWQRSCCHRYDGELSNHGERVELRDGGGLLVDAVEYGSEHPLWPEQPDGYGATLVRLPVATVGGSHPGPAGWVASAHRGGSPGRPNAAAAAAAFAGVVILSNSAEPPVLLLPMDGGDAVRLTVVLAGPRLADVVGVELQWEVLTAAGEWMLGSGQPMEAAGGGAGWTATLADPMAGLSTPPTNAW